MKEDPFAPLFNELGELLKFAEKNAGRPLSNEPIDPEIEKKLAHLEKTVSRFQKQADELIAKETLSQEGIYERLEKTPQIYTEAEKKWLRQFRDLGVNAAVLRIGIYRAMRESKYDKKRDVGKNTKKSIQKRRNKFKGVDGGENKWKRL